MQDESRAVDALMGYGIFTRSGERVSSYFTEASDPPI